MLRGAVFAITVCTGCATSTDHTAQIDAVISRCGLSGMVTVTRLSEREYRITRLDNNASYEKVDCFLAGSARLASVGDLSATTGPTEDHGFVNYTIA